MTEGYNSLGKENSTKVSHTITLTSSKKPFPKSDREFKLRATVLLDGKAEITIQVF